MHEGADCRPTTGFRYSYVVRETRGHRPLSLPPTGYVLTDADMLKSRRAQQVQEAAVAQRCTG